MKDDLEIRERFAALRQEETARMASFEQVLRRTQRRPRIGPRAFAAAACLVVAAATVILLRAPDHPPAHSAAAGPLLADWRAPTDFLLNTPVRGLLHAVPQIGEVPAGGPGRLPNDDRTSLSPAGQESHS